MIPTGTATAARLIICVLVLAAEAQFVPVSVDGMNRGLARTPLRGWNSWNWIGTAGCEDGCAAAGMSGRCHSEVMMREMAAAVVAKGLKAAGYVYINLSEGWMAECFRLGKCGNGRLPNGTIMADPVRYPSGIAALANHIHGMGLKFGIYLDAGERTCAGFPGSDGYEETDLAQVVAWGADYVWLDGCNLNTTLMPEKYELWSGLFAKHNISWEVSWPAYTFDRDYNTTAARAFNTDLWYRSAAAGQEFRFYNDNRADWLHIMDIAAATHEMDLKRFHQPGSYAFMDMLESGILPLTEAESRSHFALWVVMGQPLHLGADVRNMSASLQATATNPEVLAIADDPMCAMGSRVNMSASRLTGGQAWVRPLSDGSRAVVLLNAGVSPLPVDTCTWNHTVGGYWQTLPISPAGNLYCSNSDTPESLKARCCAAGRGVCASIAYDLGQGDACLKRNDDSGWVTDARFADWKVIGGQPDPPTPAPEQVCVSMVAAGLNPYKPTAVRDVWNRRDLAVQHGVICANVPHHDTAFFRITQ